MANGKNGNGKKNGNGGRPTSYRKEYAEQAFKLCLLGFTDAELADFFGVSETTINNWKNAHPEFLESLKRGKSVADAEVAHTLYQTAVSGNVTACIYWTKNRRKQDWRDRHELEHSAGKSDLETIARILGVKPEDLPE